MAAVVCRIKIITANLTFHITIEQFPCGDFSVTLQPGPAWCDRTSQAPLLLYSLSTDGKSRQLAKLIMFLSISSSQSVFI